MTSVDEQTIWLCGCTILGGSGFSLPTGEEVDICFGHSLLVVQTQVNDRREAISYPEIVSVTITGPGRITSGGGFIGGGFGIGGALKGMVLASVLETLTSRTEIHTILEIITHRGEIFLHYEAMEPGALRITLSPIFARLRQLDSCWLKDRLDRLAALRDRDILTTEQFDRLAQRLTDSVKPIIEGPIDALFTPEEQEKLSRGVCPSCPTYSDLNRPMQKNFVKCLNCGKQYPLCARYPDGPPYPD